MPANSYSLNGAAVPAAWIEPAVIPDHNSDDAITLRYILTLHYYYY